MITDIQIKARVIRKLSIAKAQNATYFRNETGKYLVWQAWIPAGIWATISPTISIQIGHAKTSYQFHSWTLASLRRRIRHRRCRSSQYRMLPLFQQGNYKIMVKKSMIWWLCFRSSKLDNNIMLLWLTIRPFLKEKKYIRVFCQSLSQLFRITSMNLGGHTAKSNG